MPHPLVDLLQRGNLPMSRITRDVEGVLGPLKQARVVVTERAGAGSRLVVRNAEALRAMILDRYPGLLEAPDERLGPKAGAALRKRHAHAAGRSEATPILIKGRPDTILVTPTGTKLDIGGLTSLAGIAAFMLTDGVWALTQQDGGRLPAIATVENLESFIRCEDYGVDAVAWIYTQGRMDGRVLAWVGGLSSSVDALTHLGDYDPVGLDEYLRLATFWGDRVRLYLPEGLAELFKYSDPTILEKPRNQELLAQLVAAEKSLPADAQEVLGLIRSFNAGLEQEALAKLRLSLRRGSTDGGCTPG